MGEDKASEAKIDLNMAHDVVAAKSKFAFVDLVCICHDAPWLEIAYLVPVELESDFPLLFFLIIY